MECQLEPVGTLSRLNHIEILFQTLVMIAAMPLLMIAVAILAGSGAALTEKEANAYGRAGAIGK